MNGTTGHPGLSAEEHLRAIEECIARLTTARLGVLLRGLRESRRLALRDVALLPELRSELEDIEAGRLRPSSAIIAALLGCYEADLDELVPPRETLVVTEGTDKEVLDRYLMAVRGWRGTAIHARLRQADYGVLAGILGTDPIDIRRRLQQHAIEHRIAPLSTARLGALVAKLRLSARVSRHETGSLPNVPPPQWEEVEAGRLRPDAAVLEALLRDYDDDLDQLVPPRRTLVLIEGTDKEVLKRYLAAVRRWRGSVKRPQLREDDLRVLAGILGTDPRDIQRRLRKLTGCSRRRARSLTALLLTGIAVTPVVDALHHGPTVSTTRTVLSHSVGNEVHLAVQSEPARTSRAAVTAGRAASLIHIAAARTASVRAHPARIASGPAVAVRPAAAKKAAVHAAAPKAASAAPVHSVAADCQTALAYLSAHAKPGFAHYCRPGPLIVGIGNAVAYTCVPGPTFACPDGNAEIIIADPACAATYENEASNSYWDFSTGAVIEPGSTQDGRTWDPYGECT